MRNLSARPPALAGLDELVVVSPRYGRRDGLCELDWLEWFDAANELDCGCLPHRHGPKCRSQGTVR